jgi:hypothetical protein
MVGLEPFDLGFGQRAMDFAQTLGTLLGFADAPAAPSAGAAAIRRPSGHSPPQTLDPRSRV